MALPKAPVNAAVKIGASGIHLYQNQQGKADGKENVYTTAIYTSALLIADKKV